MEAKESCLLDPQRDCIGLKRAEEVAGDLKSLDRRLSEFQHSVSDTNGRFGGRIGKLEAHNEVQDEQVRQIKETQAEIKREIAEAQKEQKNSIAELRMEHKESMAELRATNKEILAAVTPLKHKVDGMQTQTNGLSEDVEALKSKPAKTWDEIKSKALGWGVVLVLAIVAAALGLSKFL